MKITFDEDKDAIINPFGNCNKKIPQIAIACYTKKTIERLLEKYDGKFLCEVSKTPIYKIKYKNQCFTTFVSPVGAPWATMVLEDLISLGLKTIIYFGACGVLDDISEYEILIPEKSKREEGTSYHYIKDSDYIQTNLKYKEDFIKILKKEKLNYQICNNWTTDAPYRETKNKVQKYLKEGIKTVDMEASALSAVGIFRKIDVFIFFYAADKLSNKKWSKRNLGSQNTIKKDYFAKLALYLAYSISKKIIK